MEEIEHTREGHSIQDHDSGSAATRSRPYVGGTRETSRASTAGWGPKNLRVEGSKNDTVSGWTRNGVLR